jgi:tRNA (guanine-N7-)-methyltransferase
LLFIVAKSKLKKFAQINVFSNVIQPEDKYPLSNWHLRGQWGKVFFRNDHPLILEIGCGKGEYTIGLAKAYPTQNFIGIDIKGDRIYRGAAEALETGIHNVAFLRIQAERIQYFFDQNEISGIWLTFPDPQLRGSRRKKRLTSPQFLDRYRQILKPLAPIHLKTDNRLLYDYTLDVIRDMNHQLVSATDNLYANSKPDHPLLTSIQTYYEKKFLASGLPIHYLKFHLRH